MENAVHQFHYEFLSNLIGMVGDCRKSICFKPRKELTVIGPTQVEQMIEEEDADLAHA